MEDIRLDDSVRLGMVPERIDPTDMLSPSTTRGGPSRFSHSPDEVAIDIVDSPPPSQYFYRSPPMSRAHSPSIQQHIKSTPFMPTQVSEAQYIQNSMTQSMPAPVAHPPPDPPMHDAIWRSLYLVSMAGMFATGFLSWVKTNEPKLKNPIDTIHTVIHSHIHLLAVDTVIAVAVSLLWMYLLRKFVKLLMYTLLVSVPVILVAMSIWPLVQSYRGDSTTQDTAMRWMSIVPAIMSVMWVYVAHKGRNAMGRGMGIIQLSCKILGENPALVLLSFATLLGTVIFTWMWVGMFQSVFLYGSSPDMAEIGVPVFKLDTTTWIIGVYFVMMYLWTLGVAAGLQRATSAATVSQWYYYRHAIPAVSSRDVMDAALHHSFTILFGTICFSAFSAMLVRLPILVLPRRVVGLLHLFCFSFIASPIVALTHPLTLTYAAIHSQPLVYSSRAVAGMRVLDAQPGIGGGGAGAAGGRHPRAAYRLAKMLLTGTRAVMALSLGIGAWVASARGGSGHMASLYGYVVGLIAGAIGWGVLGATEGCLGNVVDACLVCVGSEPGEGGHCREAQMVFGG
ncbi:hypothetical protein DFH27DRAFT_482706 [Peziza echinospora]|nr:hypothetical protein DFH27DRAFT_482706 [Peziza echinospora]